MSKLYRIRKLVWHTGVTNSRTEWIALCLDSPIAGLGYFVKERRGMWVWKESGGEWVGAATFDAAKLAAEAHWVSRVESCLEECGGWQTGNPPSPGMYFVDYWIGVFNSGAGIREWTGEKWVDSAPIIVYAWHQLPNKYVGATK